MPERAYVGSELEFFHDAQHWKGYFASKLKPYLAGDVLEVGAGIGGSTRTLCDGRQQRWTALEPDSELALRLSAAQAGTTAPLEVIAGTTADLVGRRTFDVILYIDVLEHIANDREEMSRAAALLNPGGTVAVLAPAHPWLFSPFDRAVGHHRRYTAASLQAAMPDSLRLGRIFYLDALGLLASSANRVLLKSARPSRLQIQFWDCVLVRLSRWVDPLLGFRVGKSLLGIWVKSA